MFTADLRVANQRYDMGETRVCTNIDATMANLIHITLKIFKEKNKISITVWRMKHYHIAMGKLLVHFTAAGVAD